MASDPLINNLRQAVKKLGGPNRTATIYNAAFAGKLDEYGSKIEQLPRSTLETWMYGISKTKARDVIARVIRIAEAQ